MVTGTAAFRELVRLLSQITTRQKTAKPTMINSDTIRPAARS